MRAGSKRYGIITGVYLAVCVAAMGIFYGGVIRPQNRQWAQLHTELVELTEQYDQVQLSRTEQSKARLQERLAAVKKTWQDFVVDPARASALAFQIGQMANELKVSEFSPHADGIPKPRRRCRTTRLLRNPGFRSASGGRSSRSPSSSTGSNEISP